jgi:hypothetical protein
MDLDRPKGMYRSNAHIAALAIEHGARIYSADMDDCDQLYLESAMKKLPIGISNFTEIRTEGYYYVDKSPYVHQLAEAGKYYFLSRPRRFGKSLFVDTLKCAFEGRQDLFQDLYLENKDICPVRVYTLWPRTDSHP